jgi:2-polyprenyl-6-methoxyphenol hydroxylase-like FAD-dependent oxidoreductase
MLTVDVLVVGAGPAGLSAAITLGRYGIRTHVVEARPGRTPVPRANLASTRTMELIRSWGLEDEVRAGGVEVDFLQWIGPSLATMSSGSVFEVGVPTRAQAAVISPTGPLAVAQDHLEPVLERYLLSLESVTYESGVRVVGVRGSTVTLADKRQIGARYVIGADGSRSTVRSLVGIAMPTVDDLARFLSAEFRAPLWERLGAHRYGLYYATEGDALFLPIGAPDRWRVGISSGEVAEERLATEIRTASGFPDLPVTVERVGRYSFAAGLAERFRAGDVFLIGDAAHRVTPRGGTGLNIAMHDGFDLGWKLAFVLNGWASPALLDSYEHERRPVVEHNLARSTDPNGTHRSVSQGLDVDLGGRLKHVWLTSGKSTVDVVGPGLTQFAVRPAPAPSTVPMTVVDLTPIEARSLGIATGGALVVRPDGLPVPLHHPAASGQIDLRRGTQS